MVLAYHVFLCALVSLCLIYLCFLLRLPPFFQMVEAGNPSLDSYCKTSLFLLRRIWIFIRARDGGRLFLIGPGPKSLSIRILLDNTLDPN
jgi:hypothetical protein